jgi:hypothetical protein
MLQVVLENTAHDPRADEAVLVSGGTDKCVVCMEHLSVKETSVTCKGCFARSQSTWRCHLHCWNCWELQTCFFCKKPLVRFYNSKQRRAARRYNLRRLHSLTDCAMAVIIMLFFTTVISLFFYSYKGIETFVLRNDNDRAIFFNVVVVSLVLLVRSFKRQYLNVFVRAEFRLKFRVRRFLARNNN